MERPWKQIFAPESGTLLEIRVYETTANDYDTLLGLLKKEYRLEYLEDGNAKEMPDYSTIVRRRDLGSVSIGVSLAGLRINCFFWEENEINLDLLPDDVDFAEKAESVFEFMKMIALRLNKRVFLTAENASATRQWSEQHAICTFDPPHAQP